MNLEMAKARSKTILDLLRFGGLIPLGLVVLIMLLTSLVRNSELDSVIGYLIFPAILHAAAVVGGLLINRKAGVADMKVRALLIGAIAISFLVTQAFYASVAQLAVPFLATLTLLTLWIAALIAALAVEKGKDWTTFFVLAIFFPLITWVIVAVVNTDQAVPVTAMKTCPRCAELVKAEATLCKHCGSDIA